MIPTTLALAFALAQDPWRYVVPAADAPMEHATPMALPLGDAPSEDLRLAVEPTGFARHGELRFGDADSRRVAMLVDQRGAGDADLYLDVDRDRVLEANERVPFEDGRWVATLPVETKDAQGVVEHVPRRVVFTLGARGGVFSAATMGYLEGVVRLGDRDVAVRRVDGDVNGFFTDPRDLLWLDLDGDGEFSALGEVWLYRPLLALDGARYAFRSDRLGDGLAVEAVEGTGRIDLALPELPGGAAVVRQLNVLLIGRDGSAVGVRALGEEVEVPAGEYRLGMVTLSLVDPLGSAEWSFVFSEPGGREAVWHAVPKDAVTKIDPVGVPSFELALAQETAAPGADLRVSPLLTTSDGLLINIAYRGMDTPRFSLHSNTARIQLREGERVVGEASSGFA